MLKSPDFSQPFIVARDASNFALGAVLSQSFDGKEHPVAYASRTLNKAQMNYSTTEKECLGVVWAAKSFRCYVYGQRFTIITDYRPLCWLMNWKDPSSRLGRWVMLLADHQYDIVHRPGKQHGNADALSSVTVNNIEGLEPIWDRERIKHEQKQDPEIQGNFILVQTIKQTRRSNSSTQYNEEPSFKNVPRSSVFRSFRR